MGIYEGEAMEKLLPEHLEAEGEEEHEYDIG